MFRSYLNWQQTVIPALPAFVIPAYAGNQTKSIILIIPSIYKLPDLNLLFQVNIGTVCHLANKYPHQCKNQEKLSIWIPACAGMTRFRTNCEISVIKSISQSLKHQPITKSISQSSKCHPRPDRGTGEVRNPATRVSVCPGLLQRKG